MAPGTLTKAAYSGPWDSLGRRPWRISSRKRDPEIMGSRDLGIPGSQDAGIQGSCMESWDLGTEDPGIPGSQDPGSDPGKPPNGSMSL